MKIFVLLSALSILILSTSDCHSKKEKGAKCKGRLEIKGICYNYTIKLLEGDIDTAKIAANWIDESSGKSYTNVFGLTDPCSFPSSIKEGEEFYFSVHDAKLKSCIVCEAYYPAPPRSLLIKVFDK